MQLELLAPAKNYDSGLAAIQHGADAVYIAGPQFGARQAAGNTMLDVSKLAQYAHQYAAKTYMVLNTLLYERELETAQQLVKQAYEAGCDALIIQDMALLEMDLPPIPLFASTQMDNCNADQVQFLQDVGFKRVILARETSLNELNTIRKQTSIDLEVFVHGALCVSYSGRCYMSQALNQRSANRGSCGQLCRLPYSLYSSNGTQLAHKQHLLSLKDLNLSDYIEALALAGASSFKIEGRLKDLAYVKNITAHYRKILDDIINRYSQFTAASSGKVELLFEPDPERSFSRGFTNYFVKGRATQLLAGTAKASGKLLGVVKEVGDTYFTIDTNVAVANGDGICFFNRGQLNGTRINKSDKDRIFPLSMLGITPKMKLYRNFDQHFDQKLKQTSSIRKIEVQVKIQINAQDVLINANDLDGIQQTVRFAHSAEQAKNPDLAYQNIYQQFQKAGDSEFAIQVIELTGLAYFFTLAQLNLWRRNFVELFRSERLAKRSVEQVSIIPNSVPYPQTKLDYTSNVANSLAEQFYRRHGVETIEPAFEISPSSKVPLMYNRFCIKFELGICPSKQGGSENGPLILEQDLKKYLLTFNCKKCEMQIKELEQNDVVTDKN